MAHTFLCFSDEKINLKLGFELSMQRPGIHAVACKQSFVGFASRLSRRRTVTFPPAAAFRKAWYGNENALDLLFSFHRALCFVRSYILERVREERIANHCESCSVSSALAFSTRNSGSNSSVRCAAS